MVEVLEAKIKDLADFSSEIYDENLTLVDAIKEIKAIMSEKEKEI